MYSPNSVVHEDAAARPRQLHCPVEVQMLFSPVGIYEYEVEDFTLSRQLRQHVQSSSVDDVDILQALDILTCYLTVLLIVFDAGHLDAGDRSCKPNCGIPAQR